MHQKDYAQRMTRTPVTAMFALAGSELAVLVDFLHRLAPGCYPLPDFLYLGRILPTELPELRCLIEIDLFKRDV